MESKRNDRFVDGNLAELEDANRSPIFGYEDSPVLTLEEAVEKLQFIVPRLIDYVTTAKKKYNWHSSLLTRDESAAIYLYTMGTTFFAELNKALRAENRNTLKPWFPFLKLLIKGLNKLPSIEQTIWRGVSGNVGLEFSDGDDHIWWSINSCSLALSVVEMHLGTNGTLFAIDVIDGKDISAFSTFPEEQEIVLLPGTRVRAKCQPLSYANCLKILHLEEVKCSK